MEEMKKEILDVLKNVAPGRRIKLPAGIDYYKNNNDIEMIINREVIGYGTNANMQGDAAAFEGWASIIKAYFIRDGKQKIILDVQAEKLPSPQNIFLCNEDIDKELKVGHYGRFLYRVLRFQSEYNWFGLSDKLKDVVDEFKEIIESNICCNHLQNDEAGVNYHNEIQVEDAFARNPNELINLLQGVKEIKGDIYRQLNCWLSIKQTDRHIFTKGKSALDLWNVTNNEMNIFELKAVTKTNKNAKVGIISELFFYVHYCKDTFSVDAVFEKQISVGNERGYGLLQNRKIDVINGYMLSNEYHPLIGIEVLEVLNNNKSGITYYKVPEYDLEHMLNM